MALIKCPECGKDVSSKAPGCPNCGHPIRPAKQGKSQTSLGCGSCLLLLIIIFIFSGIFGSLSDDNKKKSTSHSTTTTTKSKTSSSPPQTSQDLSYITKGGYPASASKELFEKAIKMAVDNDTQALQKLINSNLVFILKEGVPVYVEDSSILGGWVKLRPKGETVTFYTNIEAIEKR